MTKKLWLDTDPVQYDDKKCLRMTVPRLGRKLKVDEDAMPGVTPYVLAEERSRHTDWRCEG